MHKDSKDPAKAKLIKDFLTWMITPEAQAMAAELHYAPLPDGSRRADSGPPADPEGRRQGHRLQLRSSPCPIRLPGCCRLLAPARRRLRRWRQGAARRAAASAAARPPPADRLGGTGAALTGAGATFPNPIYTKWFDAYAKETGVRINYQSIGSGGGIRQFTEGTVDFGATDGPMTDEQIKAVNGQRAARPDGARRGRAHLQPAGARARPSSSSTAPTIADIFLGRITKWNDRAARRARIPGVKLPAKDIIVVHRSDGSGTTFIFTDYLTQGVARVEDRRSASATSVNWPIGLGGKGNEGVTQQVKQSEGAIGYVELIYAISNELPYADVKNADGQFVEPSLKSVTRRGRRRRASARHRLPGVDHQRRRAPRRTRSPRSPGC